MIIYSTKKQRTGKRSLLKKTKTSKSKKKLIKKIINKLELTNQYSKCCLTVPRFFILWSSRKKRGIGVASSEKN